MIRILIGLALGSGLAWAVYYDTIRDERRRAKRRRAEIVRRMRARQ